MIKKKTCKRTTKKTTKRGKWSEEYKVKLSVKPLKRKKSGGWGLDINKRKGKVKAVKYHIRQWEYLPKEVKENFHNNKREYISWLTKKYPSLKIK